MRVSLFVAFSGGKDSTALSLGLVAKGESISLLYTPTGNEPPDVFPHIQKVAALCNANLIIPMGPSLLGLIERWGALPNQRQRWCTRKIKILPAIAWAKMNRGATLAVGLRADEESRRGGIYGDLVQQVYPLRDWGWGLPEVERYLAALELEIPERTDCMLCPMQRLGEWRALLQDRAEEYARGEALEAQTGHTFRSPSRDTWPTGLADLRREFNSGRTIPKRTAWPRRCRVCSM